MIKHRLLLVSLTSLAFLAACQKDQADAPTLSAETPASNPESTAASAPPLTKAMTTAPDWVTSLQPADALKCYADKVNDEGGAAEGSHRTFKSGGPFSLLGWSVDTSLPAGSTQPGVIVLLKGTAAQYAFPALRHDRPDVAAAPEFSAQAPKEVGVMLNGTLEGVEPGNYAVQFVVGDGAAAKLCDLGAPWNVVVTP